MGNSIVLRAAWLVIVCASCQVSEVPQDETVTSSSQPVITPTVQVFDIAIAVRDESVTALFGRLPEGGTSPTDLKIAFFDATGDVLETVSAVTAQGANSGLIYAAPAEPLTRQRQRRVIAASSAKVIVGPFTQPIYLGHAEGTISEFREDDRDPGLYGYHGCPDCIFNYICYCLPEIDGVTAPSWCHFSDATPYEEDSCDPITRLKPTPRE